VEYVRSTYESDWALFADRPDVLTRGRYVRVAPNTPGYPGLHNYGSANWRRGNGEPEQLLGEKLSAKRVWTRSVAMQRQPLPILVGDPQCVENGELFANHTPPPSLQDGFLPACFAAGGPVPGFTTADFPITDRTIQTALAGVTLATYSNLASAASQLAALMGPGTITTQWPQTVNGQLPDFVVGVNSGLAIVCIDGTTNYTQAALQAIGSLAPPNAITGFRSVPLWIDAAREVLQRVSESGWSPGMPLILVGHSYGGAVAYLAAALLRQAHPDADISVLTFGSPKPGDANLRAILNTIRSVAIRNDGDPITVTPPNLSNLLGIVFPLSSVPVSVWGAYEPAPNGFILADNGTLTPGNEPAFSITDLQTIIAAALAAEDPGTFSNHGMAEYLSRLQLTPPP